MQQTPWYNILAIIISAMGGGGVIVLAILKWWRFKSMDNAKVKHLEAQTDILIHSETMKLVNTLREEIQRKDNFLDEIQRELTEERKRCEESMRRYEYTQKLLDEERERSRQMAIEIEQLRQQLQRHENRRHP